MDSSAELPISPQQTDADAPERFDRTTLNGQAYATLKRALLSGRFRPGQVLTLRGLAASLGTSVMPVREAVSRLAGDDAFELLPNRRIRIPTLSAERSSEVWDLRVLLEGKSAALAAERVTDTEIETITALHRKVVDCANRGDLHGMLESNDTLQFAMFDAARSPVLLRIIETLRMQTAPELIAPTARLLEHRPPFLKSTLGHLGKLVRSIAARAPSQAQAAREDDLRGLKAWVRACLDDESQ